MNFLADENVDRQIVAGLRRDGHSVHYVAEMEPGISDDEVLGLANLEEAILVTADKDFGELVFRQGRAAPGIILIRLAGLSQESKREIVAAAVRDHTGEIPQSFTVISPGALRIRKRPS